MTTHLTKTWFEDGKLITQLFEEKDIYKREWVGLTMEERDQIHQECYGKVPHHVVFAHAVEAKLKEKNT